MSKKSCRILRNAYSERYGPGAWKEAESAYDAMTQSASMIRNEVRTLIEGGRSAQEIVNDMVDKYGERVLVNPPRRGLYWLAWVMRFHPGWSARPVKEKTHLSERVPIKGNAALIEVGVEFTTFQGHAQRGPLLEPVAAKTARTRNVSVAKEVTWRD